MSLHAQLSPEAMQRLAAQRRNNTISSLVIAFLAIVLLSLVLGLFLLKPMTKEVPVIITYQAPAEEEAPPEPPKPNTSPEKKPAAPSSSAAKVITSTAPSPTSVPVPDTITESPSVDFGESVDFGDGWGSSMGSGSGFASIPAGMRSRCSPEERNKRLKEAGGSTKGEKAVVKALGWLQDTQNDDGSWGDKHKVAMTGLAILAYLGHCETPKSAEYGETVEKGIVYLVNIGMQKEGPRDLLYTPGEEGHSTAYEHGIATYALAEATTFCNEIKYPIDNLDKVTKKALERILEGQTNSGGYLYQLPNGGSSGDNSVGFWQLQALKAGKHTKLFPESKFKRHIQKAMEWLEDAQGPNGAIGYRGDATRSPQLTGGGLLCMQFWGHGDSKAAKKAAEYIRENTEFTKWGNHIYYHYYNAQAMINVGGADWDWYNKGIRDLVIDGQDKDGSWNLPMGHAPKTKVDKLHMTTCLSTMLLEVYYRFLPGSK